MRPTKLQVAVFTVLNLFICAAVAVMFFMPGGQVAAVTAPSGDISTEQHNKFREASAGKADGIERETRLMGDGDETAVAAFSIEGTLFVFGNATVKGLDFDSYGGFLSVISPEGATVGFTYFDGRITAAGLAEGGFAVTVTDGGGDKPKHRLFGVGYDGVAYEAAELDGGGVDVLAVGGSTVAVVTAPDVNSFKLTEYTVGEPGARWASGRSTRISGGFVLEYFDCFAMGGEYVIAARASSLPRYDAAVFYSFRVGSDASAHFFGGSGENMITPSAVIPYESGYLLAGRKDGVAAFFGVSYSFTGYRHDLLGFSYTSARLMSSGDRCYASFTAADGAVNFELDQNLSYRKIPAAVPLQVAASGKEKVLVGPAFTVVDGNNIASFDVKDCEVTAAFAGEDGVTVVLSAAGGGALSAPSGGKDIYVITVKL